MPILIILGVVLVGVGVSVYENGKEKTSSKYPFNGTDQEKTAWICEQNQKRIDKMLKK